VSVVVREIDFLPLEALRANLLAEVVGLLLDSFSFEDEIRLATADNLNTAVFWVC
jgi:hypothetical protein